MIIQTKRDLEFEVEGRSMTLFAGVQMPAEKKLGGYIVNPPFNFFIDSMDAEEVDE